MVVHGKVRENDGLPSCHIFPGQSPLADILVAVENSAWLQFSSIHKCVDPTVNEGVQLHEPMVAWWILNLLIFAKQSDVIVSEIILPKW